MKLKDLLDIIKDNWIKISVFDIKQEPLILFTPKIHLREILNELLNVDIFELKAVTNERNEIYYEITLNMLIKRTITTEVQNA